MRYLGASGMFEASEKRETSFAVDAAGLDEAHLQAGSQAVRP